MEAKRKKDRAWKGYKINRSYSNWEQYKQARNEYTKVRRDEQRNYEKKIVEKCADKPKLFYKFINNKIKNKEMVNTMRENDIVYEDSKTISEILNKNFQSVFT